MKNQLIIATLWLLKSPLIWGGLYFVMIPLFGVIYTLLPSGSFYHQTAKYEPPILADKTAIENGLTATMLAQINLGRQLRDGWAINTLRVDRLHVSDDAADDAPMTFDISLTLLRRSTARGIEMLGGLHPVVTLTPNYLVTVPIGQDKTDVARAVREARVIHYVSMSPLPSGTLLDRDVFPYHDKEMTAGKSTLLPVSLKLEAKMLEYSRARKGFPSLSSSDQFGRMLYLSAITITTVGYGDILPLTHAARLATALEAVVGITIIGFFLNALAFRISAR